MADSNTKLLLRKEAIESAKLSLKNFPTLLERPFVPTKDAAGISEKSEFRVMQWNVLADGLSSSSSTSNFIKCPIQALIWSNRKKHSLQEMLTYNPDIICLEEVDHYPDFYCPRLQELGFDGIFLPKKDSPCLKFADNSGPDGCAIFVDRERFLLKNTKEITLEDSEGQTTNQVALLVKLFDKIQEKVLYCVVTHLKAKTGFKDLRLAQGKCILKALEEFMKDEISGVILCGDFNAEPSEPVYSAMEEGFEGVSLKSAYKTACGKEPDFTTYKVRPQGEVKHTIDYVWHSSNFKVSGYLEVPQEEDIGKDALPSMAYPSDHLSLVFDFYWG